MHRAEASQGQPMGVTRLLGRGLGGRGVMIAERTVDWFSVGYVNPDLSDTTFFFHWPP